MKNKIILFAVTFLSTINLNAQCAMCKAVVESNLKEGGSVGAGLNNGILYLMAMPYVAALLFGIFYFLQKRRETASTVFMLKYFFQLLKSKLSITVVFSALAGYWVGVENFEIENFIYLIFGFLLASANALIKYLKKIKTSL